MAEATARKRKNEAADSELDEGELLEIPPQEKELADLQAQYPDDTLMLHIYRQGQHARDLELIDEIPFKMFKPMDLAFPPYNGGTFRVHARTDTGLAYNRMWKVQRKTQDVPVAAKAGISDMDVARVIDERMALVLARLPQPAAPVDPMAQFKVIADLVKTLMPAPVAAAAPVAVPSFMEELTKFTALQKLMETMGGGRVKDADGKTDWSGTLLEKGVDLVGDMMKNAQAQQQRPQPAATAPMLPNPAQPVASVPIMNEGADLTETGDEEMKLLWKLALRRACKSAAAGEKPEDFDDEWGSMVPDEVLDDLEENPEWFAEICKINPDCQLHEQWFTDLRVLLLGEPVTPVDNSLESVQATASTNSDAETLHKAGPRLGVNERPGQDNDNGDSGTVLPAPPGPSSGT